MPAISSSAIRFVDYDDGNMMVVFTSGARYTYHSVPQEVYQAFLHTGSHGSYFNRVIRPNYTFTRG